MRSIYLMAALVFGPMLEAATPVRLLATWDQVTTHEDGTPCIVRGYRLYIATSQEALATVGVAKEVEGALSVSFELDCGPVYWFAVTAFNENGDESSQSEAVSVDLACPHHAPKAPGRPTVTIVPEVPIIPVIPGIITLEEHFDSSSLPAGWVATDEGTLNGPAVWRIVTGALHQMSAINDGTSQAATAPMLGARLRFFGGSYGDGTYKARIMASGGSVLGFLFRVNGSTCYRFCMSRTANPHFRRLQRIENGVVSTLAEDSVVTFPQGIWQAIEIVAMGGHLVIKIDGVQIFDVTDTSPLPAGTIGVYAWNNAYAYFDDVVVEAK